MTPENYRKIEKELFQLCSFASNNIILAVYYMFSKRIRSWQLF